jgi:hypothetical protein
MPSTLFNSDPDSYGAKLRAKGVQVSPAGMARHNGKTPGSNAQYNGWERGIASEARPDGTRMPYLNGDGAAIPIKTFTENRSKYDEIRKRQLTAP